MVGYVEFVRHIEQAGVRAAVFDDVVAVLVRQFLDGIVDVVLDGFEQCFAFLVQLAIGAKILALEFQYLVFFAKDFLLALGSHSLGEEYLLGLVVGCQHANLLLQGINLFLPAFGDKGQLVVGRLVLRQVVQDILQVNISYRLVFGKNRATQQQGCNEQ